MKQIALLLGILAFIGSAPEMGIILIVGYAGIAIGNAYKS